MHIKEIDVILSGSPQGGITYGLPLATPSAKPPHASLMPVVSQQGSQPTWERYQRTTGTGWLR
ncbi:hypothetical protein Pure05_35860 [Paenarthrobacter ureafaciens]|nr:hypothetical protein ARZXY2_4325 [Arthrobacter sp. ZXY-2]GLU61122.1 hypothetical protein Pure01_36350 [Paenarthrobacter ureafaciens]GLU65391.1 hypothetical protein Pure02_36410 [Paenarthrobacter ureafaciens]GLU69778.1 hypothetical protein Pure03_37540 [Paenarthrobacter ureafaciens]GLU73905.1 hypothetical protein Pure04_36200 [Paenarthrobacter ureafaciens]